MGKVLKFTQPLSDEDKVKYDCLNDLKGIIKAIKRGQVIGYAMVTCDQTYAVSNWYQQIKPTKLSLLAGAEILKQRLVNDTRCS